MASSSVSQEDLENDFELSSRRTRIRTARARTVNPPTRIGMELILSLMRNKIFFIKINYKKKKKKNLISIFLKPNINRNIH